MIIKNTMVTLVTLLGADAKFLCILVSIPYEELCVGVYGFHCSVVNVLSILVSLENFVSLQPGDFCSSSYRAQTNLIQLE